MDYKKAKELRGKKFSELMTEKLLEEQGVSEAFRKTLSEKSKARSMGYKQAFDPLNIIKMMTGDSNLGPAILGRILGRSQEDIEFFAGKAKQKGGKKLKEGQLNIHKKFQIEEENQSLQVLGLIYRQLLRAQEIENSNLIDDTRKQQEEAAWEDKRNEELIKALTARRKPKKEKKVPEGKKPEEKKVTKPPAEKEVPKPTEKAPTAKGTPKPSAEKIPQKEVPKPSAKEVTKEVPKEAPKPPAPKEVAPPKAPPVSTAEKVAKGVAIGAAATGAGAIIAALTSAGISPKGQANILAQVEAESNFKPQSENLNYTKAEGIQNTFGKGRIPTLEFAQTLVRNPEALAEAVYGKDTKAGKQLGNTEVGDGYKYRGRGYIQHTGKKQYEEIKKYTGIDVVSNPDLLNDPGVAAKAIAWFFLVFKGKKPHQLENISEVNKAVGFADKKLKSGEMESDHRVKLAEKYSGVVGVPSNQALPQSLPTNTGDKIDISSKENKQLKDKSKDKPAIQENTTNVSNKSGGQSKPSKPKGDDTNAYQQKVQQ